MPSAAPLPAALTLRPATAADLPAVQRLYAHHVAHASSTFELEAPSLEEIARRHADVLAKGLPWLVAEREAVLVGYAYASLFRPRPAYRFCVENSVYVEPRLVGMGIGRLLLAELVARCEAAGARQMLAVIGDGTHNAASVGLHSALGFEHCGLLRAVGWKFGRWLDVVLMQRTLGPGAACPPTEESPR